MRFLHTTVCVLCFALCLGHAHPVWSQTEPDISSSTAIVTITDCPVMLEHRYIVPARSSGIVESLDVVLNQSVQRGQLLLRLENQDEKDQVATAKSAYAYAKQLAADDCEIKMQKFALLQAEEEMRSANEAAQSFSASELRKRSIDVESAKTAVNRAELAFQRAGIQADQAVTAWKIAATKLANREVHAPSEGIVRELLVRPGEFVELGKPVMIVADYRTVQVDCWLPLEKTDVTKLNDLDVLVELKQGGNQGAPVQLKGKITSYDPKLNAQGEVRVHCRIDNVQRDGVWLLWPEMNVTLKIALPARGHVEA